MELSELTFADVLQLQLFKDELVWQLSQEMLTVEKAKTKGKLRRMAMDSLRERGVFTADKMTSLFYQIKHKELKGYSAEQRKYINDVCMMAYQRTIIKLQDESEENDRNPLLRWLRHLWAWFCIKIKGEIPA